MKKLIMVLVLMTSIVMLSWANGQADAGAETQSKYVLTMGATIPESNSQAEYWNQFKALVESESDGRLVVNLNYAGSLGNDTELIQKTQLNTIQGFNTSSSNFANTVEGFRVFDLPYVVSNPLDHKVFYSNGRFGGPVGDPLQEAAAEKNIRILWTTPFLFRALVTRDVMAKVPGDIRGLKIRTSASPIERAIIESFDATPVTMGVSEVYTALQQKTVDGEDLPADVLPAFKHDEVAKYATMNNFQGFAALAGISLSFYESLPDDLKVIVDNAASEVTTEADKKFMSLIGAGLADVEKAGVKLYYPTEAEMEIWKTKAYTVYDSFADEIDPQWRNTVVEYLESVK